MVIWCGLILFGRPQMNELEWENVWFKNQNGSRLVV